MNNNTKSLKWVYCHTKKFLPWVTLISLINAVSSIILVLLATVSRNIIDSSANNAVDALLYGGLFLFSMIILQVLLDFIYSMLAVRISTKMNISLKNYMFSTLLKKKYASVIDYHSGDLLNRFSSDVEQITHGITIIPSVISMLTKIVAGVSALIVENYLFALAVLFVGFFIPLIGRMFSNKFKKLHKNVLQSEGKTRSFLQECFANIIVIKTFSAEKAIVDKLNDYMGINRMHRIKHRFISTLVSLLLYLCFTLGYYAVLVWGAGQIASGIITAGTLIYFLQLISMLRSPLQNITGIIPRYYSMTASAERLIELENLPSEFTVSSEIDLKKDFKHIVADRLSFGYDNNLILNKCSFNIEKNTITALTGDSGIGKSTLLKLLLGLYEPIGGSLSFDGKITIDETTRKMFSYVPQGNMVLSGTIRDNITLCRDSVSDEDVISAAKTAVIYDFIESLPDGFDTVLSERGVGLSEGQIQRIAIARALLFDAPIILLDECTSALDLETEKKLLENLKHFTDKTIIFATHRKTSVDICDNVLHIEDGTLS